MNDYGATKNICHGDVVECIGIFPLRNISEIARVALARARRASMIAGWALVIVITGQFAALAAEIAGLVYMEAMAA